MSRTIKTGAKRIVTQDGKTVVDLTEGTYAIRDKDNNIITIFDEDGVKIYHGDYYLQDENSGHLYRVGTGKNLIKNHNFEDMGTNIVGGNECEYYITYNSEGRLYDLDTADTMLAQSFGYTLPDAGIKITGVRLCVAIPNGTSVTVRIETDNAGKPSGTLADANAAKDFKVYPVAGKTRLSISAFWIDMVFDTGFELASGVYWIVISIDNTTSSVMIGDAKDAFHGGYGKYTTDLGVNWNDLGSSVCFAVVHYHFTINTYESPAVYGMNCSTRMNYWGRERVSARDWIPIGLPRIYYVDDNDDYYLEGTPTGFGGGGDFFLISDKTIFDRKTPIVNNKDYVTQKLRINENMDFTLSAFAAPRGGTESGFYGNSSGSQLGCRLNTEYWNDDYGKLGEKYTDTTICSSYGTGDENRVVRATHNFTTPATTDYIKIYAQSASSEWIRIDGVQLCGGDYPASYNAESEIYRRNEDEDNDDYSATYKDNNLVPCNADLTLTTAAQDISGCSITYKASKSGYLFVTGVFDFTTDGIAIGELDVNGTTQAAQSHGVSRGTYAQKWLITITAGNQYILKLQAKRSGGTEGTCYQNHTIMAIAFVKDFTLY